MTTQWKQNGDRPAPGTLKKYSAPPSFDYFKNGLSTSVVEDSESIKKKVYFMRSLTSQMASVSTRAHSAECFQWMPLRRKNSMQKEQCIGPGSASWRCFPVSVSFRDKRPGARLTGGWAVPCGQSVKVPSCLQCKASCKKRRWAGVGLKMHMCTELSVSVCAVFLFWGGGRGGVWSAMCSFDQSPFHCGALSF